MHANAAPDSNSATPSRRGRAIHSGVLALLLLALGLLGCGPSQPRVRPPGAPPEPYVVELERLAEDAAAHPVLTLRYNPCDCQCPEFEIRLGPRWVRVALADLADVASTAGQLLGRAKLDRRAGRIGHYRVAGKLRATPERCAQGALYVSLSVSALDPPPLPKSRATDPM